MGSNRGQQCGEYAAMVGLVALAFIGAQRYISSRIAGALIDQSHAALGPMVPLEEGTGSSDVVDRVYEHSNGSTFTTQVVSTSTGNSQAGFILAEPPGFAAVKEEALANGASGWQILKQFPEQVPELEGYELSDYFTDENGKTIGIFKKADKVKYKGYKALDDPLFDPVSGTVFTGLDLDDNGKYDPGKDLSTVGMLAGDFLIADKSVRSKERLENLEALQEALHILDTEAELDFSGSGKATLKADIQAGIEESHRGLDGRAYTLKKAYDAAGTVFKADARSRRETNLAQIPWSSSEGYQLLEDRGLLPRAWYRLGGLAGPETSDEPLFKDKDRDWKTLQSIAEAVKAIEDFIKPPGKEDGVFAWAQWSDTWKHRDEIAVQLKTAREALERFDERMNQDGATEDFKAAAQALDVAYAMLVNDIDAALGLNQPPNDDTQSIGAPMLAEFSGRPDVDQFLQDPQYDIDGDRISDVMVSEDGQAQGFGQVVFTERDLFAEDGGGMTVSNVSSELSAAMTRAEPHEVLKAIPGLPPAELIFRAGWSPRDLEGVTAWVPLSESGEPIPIEEMAEMGVPGLGQTTSAISLPPFDPPGKPYDPQ